MLLKNGADPNLASMRHHYPHSKCSLPLCVAVAKGCSYEIIKLLIKAGASVNTTDASGNTALHYGIEQHNNATTLQYKDEVKTAINSTSVVDILLENRADVNILNKSGETPLYRAVSRGLLDVVSKMLQTCGGNPNTPSPDQNLLVAACEKCNVELVDMLLKNGADPNLASLRHHYPNTKCRLPLFIAVTHIYRKDNIIRLLIKAGANVNATDHEGKTAFCIATECMTNNYGKSQLATTRTLLEHGADSNVLMPDGRSPLYLVISVIGAITEHARRTHIIDWHGRTYLITLLELMVEHGAILSDSFSRLAQDANHQSQRVLKDLATFDDTHKFIVDLFRAGAGFHLLALCCTATEKLTYRKEVRSIRMCQAAVLAGYTPSVAELQSLQLAAASEDGDGGLLGQLVNWLNEDTQRVPSLLRQCRVVIRRQLSTAVQHRSILTSINELPLPNSVKMYVRFEGKLTEVDLSFKKII